MNSYAVISGFGSSDPSNSNPLAVCAVTPLDGGFNNKLGANGLLDSSNRQCQIYMGSYCGQKWDGVCEYLSKDTSSIPNMVHTTPHLSGGIGSNNLGGFTRGELLIRNAAADRFLVKMSDNCSRSYEPFDPTTADSPLISTWLPDSSKTVGTSICVPIYDVDAKTIDQDPVMNKILDKPYIAMDILINICTNRLKNRTVFELKGTRLYDLFSSQGFQQVVRSGNYK